MMKVLEKDNSALSLVAGSYLTRDSVGFVFIISEFVVILLLDIV